MPSLEDNPTLHVSETGEYRRSDDGPADDSGVFQRDVNVENDPPPAPRDRSQTPARSLPNLRNSIQGPSPLEQPKRHPARRFLPLIGAGAVACVLLLMVAAAVLWVATGDGATTAEELEEQRRATEAELGVPVRDGLNTKRKQGAP